MAEPKVLRCSSATDSNKLASSIHATHQDDAKVPIVLRVIGAGALNQAIKASIICNKFFAKKGTVIVLQPSFQDMDGMTAIELKVLFMQNNPNILLEE